MNSDYALVCGEICFASLCCLGNGVDVLHCLFSTVKGMIEVYIIVYILVMFNDGVLGNRSITNPTSCPLHNHDLLVLLLPVRLQNGHKP